MVGKRYLIEMKGVPTVCPEGFNEGFVACGYLERRRGLFGVGDERGNGGDSVASGQRKDKKTRRNHQTGVQAIFGKLITN